MRWEGCALVTRRDIQYLIMRGKKTIFFVGKTGRGRDVSYYLHIPESYSSCFCERACVRACICIRVRARLNWCLHTCGTVGVFSCVY